MIGHGSQLLTITANTVAHYTLNSGATDSTGVHDGTLQNTPTSVAGPVDRAYSFDSASLEYISVPDDNALSFGNGTTDSPFSIEFVVQTSGYISSSNKTPVITKGHVTYGIEYFAKVSESTSLLSALILCDNTSGNVEYRLLSTSDTSLTFNKFTYYAFTYSGNGSRTGIKLYINGENFSGTTGGAGSYTAMENETDNFRIGSYTPGESSTSYFDGEVAEVALSDVELSADYIKKTWSRMSHLI